YAYDKFWDIIRVERTREYDREQKYKQMYVDDLEKATEKGWTEGMEKGMAKGMEEGLEKGMKEGMAKGLEKGMAKGLEKGRAKGKAEGRVEGIEEANHDNARKMKALGLTVELISQVTGLSAEEIEPL
ncbi:MAG: hypothetical protein IJK42_06395, partial [Prevotella sp.]|nr:hypothetical protein [Prevotella sp.]